jgi:hypothetical protein
MVIGILIGAIIWLMFELNKAYIKPEFNWAKFILLNWLPFSLNIICGLTILWFEEDIKEIMPITKVYAVIIGMSGQGIFKKLVGIFDKKIETKFGINENNA